MAWAAEFHYLIEFFDLNNFVCVLYIYRNGEMGRAVSCSAALEYYVYMLSTFDHINCLFVCICGDPNLCISDLISIFCSL